ESRWDLDRTVEGFRREGGEQAAAAARAHFTNRSEETLAAFLTHCWPAYSPAPLDPAMATRPIMNIDLMNAFFHDLEFDFNDSLKVVTCPTLVLAGAHDPITPRSAAEEIVAALTGADVRFEVFERSGHFIQDTEPERFFALLEAFVSGTDAP